MSNGLSEREKKMLDELNRLIDHMNAFTPNRAKHITMNGTAKEVAKILGQSVDGPFSGDFQYRGFTVVCAKQPITNSP